MDKSNGLSRISNKNALREFIDTKTFQNEFYHDFQEYGNKTYAEIRRVLGAFNFSEKYIQELAHQYWTMMMNLMIEILVAEEIKWKINSIKKVV